MKWNISKNEMSWFGMIEPGELTGDFAKAMTGEHDRIKRFLEEGRSVILMPPSRYQPDVQSIKNTILWVLKKARTILTVTAVAKETLYGFAEIKRILELMVEEGTVKTRAKRGHKGIYYYLAGRKIRVKSKAKVKVNNWGRNMAYGRAARIAPKPYIERDPESMEKGE